MSGYPPYDPSRYAPPPQQQRVTYDYVKENPRPDDREFHLRRTYYYDSDPDDWTDSEDERRDRRRRSRSRSRSRSNRRSRSASSARSARKVPSESYTISKAAKSAAMAAAVEAIRCRREPGSWHGQKGARLVTAAVSGAVIGYARNGRLRKDGKLPIAEAAVSGFYAVDFLKRVLRHTEFESPDEQEKDREERVEKEEKLKLKDKIDNRRYSYA